LSIHADIQTVINNESGNSTFLSQLVYMGNAIEPKEIILGGDPQQLRARVQTTFAKENNINISLMELYLEAYGLDMTNLTNTTLLNESCEICMLKTSYRCVFWSGPKNICCFVKSTLSLLKTVLAIPFSFLSHMVHDSHSSCSCVCGIFICSTSVTSLGSCLKSYVF